MVDSLDWKADSWMFGDSSVEQVVWPCVHFVDIWARINVNKLASFMFTCVLLKFFIKNKKREIRKKDLKVKKFIQSEEDYQ